MKLLTSFFLVLFSFNFQPTNELNVEDKSVDQKLIIVRLFDRTGKKEALKEKGYDLQVKLTELEVKEENIRIMDAFNHIFDDTKVLYFYAKNTRQLLDRQFENLFFDNEFNLLKDVDLPDNYFVIDYGIGNVKDSNERYNFEGFRLHKVESGKIEYTGLYKGAGFGFFSKTRRIEKALKKLRRKMKF